MPQVYIEIQNISAEEIGMLYDPTKIKPLILINWLSDYIGSRNLCYSGLK